MDACDIWKTVMKRSELFTNEQQIRHRKEKKSCFHLHSFPQKKMRMWRLCVVLAAGGKTVKINTTNWQFN